MKLQVCRFKRKRNSDWEVGVAIMSIGFGLCDITDILDCNGKLIGEKGPWDYSLVNQPIACAIDTDIATTL